MKALKSLTNLIIVSDQLTFQKQNPKVGKEFNETLWTDALF